MLLGRLGCCIGTTPNKSDQADQNDLWSDLVHCYGVCIFEDTLSDRRAIRSSPKVENPLLYKN